LQDIYQRKISYLRISLTDRCNLRCIYCMPPEGVQLTSHQEILRNEEIFQVVKAASRAGIVKVRFTGGEPLIRKGILSLIDSVRSISEIQDISLTTNGIFLSEMAEDLKRIGVDRINISLDTLNKDIYRKITVNGDLNKVWQGIEKALGLGFEAIKINTVVIPGLNSNEVADLAALTLVHPLHIRFIELMPKDCSGKDVYDSFVPVAEIRDNIEQTLGSLKEAESPPGNGPANYFILPGAKGTVGFISPLSQSFCHLCNRIRLTADGMIRPCLYSEKEFDFKTPLRNGATTAELAALFDRVMEAKPEQHSFQQGWTDKTRAMFQIGG
jgi:cyclic pyranopterin phosphate synthase